MLALLCVVVLLLLLSQGDDDEVWWEASFEIPKGAVAVNFVVNCDNAWDNNGGKDHKVGGIT